LFSYIACENFAVLVAGSNTYGNYRHQSDIFHTYHILTGRGVKPENIIVFAYDDVANNSRNPFPGKVFNKPDGNDVYEGVVIDYYAKDVNPENFIAAITGNAEGVTKKDERTTGKVLTSTENDNVFIYFTDHGSDNLICFPGKYLYADELNDALKTMHEKKLYKELVFYLEACYSGSMFKGKLPTDIHIYTTTAANEKESSYAEYCGAEAKVNGTSIGSCLGDEYSVRYMEDIDSRPGEELKSYTMQEQYEYLVGAVKGSHVQQFGDLEIAKKSIFYFVSDATKKIFKTISNILPSMNYYDEGYKINNLEHRLEYLKQYALTHNDIEAENEYFNEVAAEGRSTMIFELFNKKFHLAERNHDEAVDFDCYREVVNAYKNKCGMLIDRDFKFMTHIANFCTKGINPKKAAETFSTICE
jgi:legumain